MWEGLKLRSGLDLVTTIQAQPTTDSRDYYKLTYVVLALFTPGITPGIIYMFKAGANGKENIVCLNDP